jgi:hypothetical protein
LQPDAEASFWDSRSNAVFYDVVIVIINESVFFVQWESLCWWERELSGFPSHFVARVMELVYEGAVVCVASDPDRLEREGWVSFGDCREEPVP